MALRPKVETREALLARRDALMSELVALDAQLDQRGADRVAIARKRARAVATLDRIYRQLEALGRRKPG